MLIDGLRTFNQLLTAGITITAFSLLLYALTFNLRDRIARSFAVILLCVVVVFVTDAFTSATSDATDQGFWLRLQWLGIVFLPASYLQFSDALLATTGRPSRGRRRMAVRLAFLFSILFLISLPFGFLVGSLIRENTPAPYLQHTGLTYLFLVFYAGLMVVSWVNLWRASKRTVTTVGHRRMRYLLAGSIGPVLGSFPFLLFGSNLAEASPILFWMMAILSNLLVMFLLVIMAYAVAFFGVPWPDRVVKRRLFKWLMRGPVTASIVLALTTLARRFGELFGQPYTGLVPIIMVGSLLLLEYSITLAAPVWERWLFLGGDREKISMLQILEERLLTSGDLRQFLESILAAVCDRFQTSQAFIVVLNQGQMDIVVEVGDHPLLNEENPETLVRLVYENGNNRGLFTWGKYWLMPLFSPQENQQSLLGIMGISKVSDQVIDGEQRDALKLLSLRASLALEDRAQQQVVFNSLEALNPQVELIQRLRAASRYGGTGVLTDPYPPLEPDDLAKWVKDALTHYWGGPKLTSSPLIRLKIVQRILDENEDSPANALRVILKEAIEQVRPTGERRFTGEWILYNILEMKFMEGRKVRDVAMRLALSEADLYRKQRVAIETVANAILNMEQKVREEGR